MADAIILTQNQERGAQLKKRLALINPAFKYLPVVSKDKMVPVEDCAFIFSTWGMPRFSEKEIRQRFPNLKAVFYAAGTVKDFAGPFLDAGVRVFSAAAANGVAVAEFAAAQIILANKGYFQATRAFRWPIWRRGFRKLHAMAEAHAGNMGATVGILGCGAIGSRVVELLRGYDLTVKVYDPYLSEERVQQLGVQSVGMDEIFSSCDVISNHLPNIPDTQKIINERLLTMMKPYATLVNTGRGAQIDESALARVMRKRRDLTALLDVTTHEPPFPWSGLFRRRNIFLSPHIAGSLNHEVDRMADFAASQYADYMAGTSPQGEITLSNINSKA